MRVAIYAGEEYPPVEISPMAEIHYQWLVT